MYDVPIQRRRPAEPNDSQGRGKITGGIKGCRYVEEKRTANRFKANIAVTYAPFSSKGGSEHEATAVNHCADGIGLRSNFPIQPGTDIYVRQRQRFAVEGVEGDHTAVRTVTLARVKWCKTVHDSSGAGYHIGVKYY